MKYMYVCVCVSIYVQGLELRIISYGKGRLIMIKASNMAK